MLEYFAAGPFCSKHTRRLHSSVWSVLIHFTIVHMPIKHFSGRGPYPPLVRTHVSSRQHSLRVAEHTCKHHEAVSTKTPHTDKYANKLSQCQNVWCYRTTRMRDSLSCQWQVTLAALAWDIIIWMLTLQDPSLHYNKHLECFPNVERYITHS